MRGGVKSRFSKTSSCPVCWRKNSDGTRVKPTLSKPASGNGLPRPSSLEGRRRADFHHGPESLTPIRPDTLPQTPLPPWFFACIPAADHTFRKARLSGPIQIANRQGAEVCRSITVSNIVGNFLGHCGFEQGFSAVLA